MSAQFHDLKGKSVFITGGGSGIGAFLTEGFLAQGAKVAFVGRSDASAFCDEMEEKHGSRPLFIACDITDIAALQTAMNQASDANGPLYALVNNAANDKRHDTLEVDETFWDWSQSINLKAYFFACQEAIKGMKENGGGSISRTDERADARRGRAIIRRGTDRRRGSGSLQPSPHARSDN